ncbi:MULTISPECIES: SRPBCC family protein [unclassified Clostridioides]|uniref:SRPBCC family protein n=2 Tax=Clostridioides TaxID=1870884 RepID=UPI001D0CC6A4|nr:SRPBCC family protein [Clostridioides sp. ES-S-0001-03]MCC0704727.1 SRPBCC family protein [Clostridioides sp. ES-S-0049-02]MCC0707986.1 SRPBCC family protein [Clostridioides sp. ES-S-0190-01]UDN58844.1 SRPBCC family protein [Clostridioides sp. ES-S-0010-02]
MKKCRVSEITAYFNADVETVWNIVTDNRDYKWRSDISKIEVFDDGSTFIEYNKDGNSTKFTVTEKTKNKLYKFNMENKFFYGNWQGEFFEENEKTKIVFIENIYVKNPIIKILSYLFMNLKKIQMQYVEDLKRKLNEM